jgi:hypothetical protein
VVFQRQDILPYLLEGEALMSIMAHPPDAFSELALLRGRR